MKKLLFILLLTGCTQKYAGYDLIRKVDFNKENYERPITVMQVLPEGRDRLESCFNQWLFFSNAEKEKNQAIPYLIRSLCPGKDYLLDAEMKELWWTTIIFTRSCVSVETMCAQLKKSK
jgi:superfamily II DNA/RNA helicase